MGRPARIDYPGARHHVINWGTRHAQVFPDDASYRAFCEHLKLACDRHHLRVHGFVLMPDHFHLMLESLKGTLSQGMALLQAQYTQRTNRSFDWDGPVFKGRFHNRLVVNDEHWWYLLFHLHLNPCRAQLSPEPGAWPWSSHRHYSGEDIAADTDLVYTKEINQALDGAGGYAPLLLEIQSSERRPPDQFEQILFGESRRSSAIPLLEKKDDVSTRFKIGNAWKQVAAVTGIDLTSVTRSLRGRKGNPAKRILCWWLAYDVRLPNVQIGEQLGLSPSTVCRLIGTAHKEMVLEREPVCTWARILKEEKSAHSSRTAS